MMLRSRFLSAALLLACATAISSHEPTAQFRSDAERTGVYPPADRSYAGIQWRYRTNGAVRSSPVIANGIVYVGSTDGTFYAIDARRGTLRWRFAMGAPVSSSAAISNGIAYVQSHAGVLYALNAANGRRVWRIRFGADAPLAWGHESGDFYDSSAAVAGPRLFVGAGDGYLYAIDRGTGHVVWRARTGGRVRSSPAVEGTSVYVGSFDGDLYAFDAGSGTQKWRFATEGAALRSGDFGYDRRSIQSSPAVSNGAVFFGSRDGFVYSVDAATGKLRWRYDHHISWSNTSPAVERGLVFAGTSDGCFVQALDRRSGTQRWRFTTASNVFASVSSSGGAVYAADWSGTVYALDEATGKELWRSRITPSRIFSTPAIESQRLFVGSDDGTVTAYNLGGRGIYRAVYFDAGRAAQSTLPSSEQIAKYFEARGYAALDATELPAFMRARANDRAPSVIVFAQDVLPGPATAAMRTYLGAGGKAVWLGMPPGMMTFDEKAGSFVLPLHRDVPQRLTGISFERGNFDLLTTHTTRGGELWGLHGWFVSNYAADPGTVTSVLATDEQGLAAAYVKSFGGPGGTGFVRVPVITGDGGYATNLDQIQTAAEYFPD